MNTSSRGLGGGAEGDRRRSVGPRRPGVLRLGGAGVSPKPSSARRCLFGPVDHQETDDFLREMNRQLDEQKKELWGFDFKAGRPVPGGHPVYEWVAVGASDAIPCAYGRMGESWWGPEIASWANENTEMGGVSPNSYRLKGRSRKRLRLLSPELDTALTSDCSNAEKHPDREPDKALAEHSSGCSNADGNSTEGASGPGNELPPKDLRKSEEKLEKHSGSKPSDVPGRLEGSDLPSVVRTKVADTPEDFPATTEDSVVALPNPCCDALPEKK